MEIKLRWALAAFFSLGLLSSCESESARDYIVRIDSKHPDTDAETEDVVIIKAENDTIAYSDAHWKYWSKKLAALTTLKQFRDRPEFWPTVPFYFSLEQDGRTIVFEKSVAERITESTMKFINEKALPGIDSIQPLDFSKADPPKIY